MNIFNPLSTLTRAFSINYAERLRKMTEAELYEAKKQLINAAVMRHQAESSLTYNTNRVKVLSEALAELKGAELAQVTTSISTSTNDLPTLIERRAQ